MKPGVFGFLALTAAWSATAPALAAEAACPRVEITRVQPAASPGTRPVASARDGVVQVELAPIVQLSDIAAVALSDDAHPALLLGFTPDGARRLEEATTGHDGLRIAFVVDDDALLSVVWEGPYGIGRNGMQINMAAEGKAAEVAARIGPCLAE